MATTDTVEFVSMTSCHGCYNSTQQTVRNVHSDTEYVYVILTAVTSGLSIAGGSFTCVLYIIYRDMRTTGRKLLLFLGFSDAMLAFGNLLGIIWYLYCDSKVIHRSETYCSLQSALTIYFSMTSFAWTVIMAVCLLKTVVFNDVSFTATYMKLFHLLSWIPPGIIVMAALGMGVLGTDVSLEQASWCWIDPRVPNALVWQFATGKFWEIVAYITTVVLYTIIKIFLGRQADKTQTMVSRNKSRQHVIAETNRRLTFVPLVFIVCRIWGTLRFLLGNFAVEYINEPYIIWINPLQGIGDSAQGFANCTIYCLTTEKIRRRLFRLLNRHKGVPASNMETELHSHVRSGKRSTVGIHHQGTSVAGNGDSGVPISTDRRTNPEEQIPAISSFKTGDM